MNPHLLAIYIKIKDRVLFIKRDQMRAVFSEIYQRGGWASDSVSGIGSTVEATQIIRRELPLLLKHLGISSLLDAPCGDFNWMKEIDLTGIRYIGVDIVNDLIARDREFYASEAREFRVLDIAKDELPKVDLILCRDCLIHLSFRNCARAIENFKASGSKYLLTTTYTSISRNADIFTGSWRPLNLQAPPFNFPLPLELIVELPSEGRSLGLWALSDLI